MANLPLLKQVRDLIEIEPHKLEMGDWESYRDEGEHYYNPAEDDYVDPQPNECGTTRCIAGWAIYLEGVKRGLDPTFLIATMKDELYRSEHGWLDHRDAGILALGITEEEADTLFYTGNDNALRCLNGLIERYEHEEK